MGKWDNIKFKIVEAPGRLVILGDVVCGVILGVSSNGVSRAKSVGGAFGFDRDDMGRVKFFKGCTPMTFANEINFSYTVSSLGWNNRVWYLRKNGDMLILGCSGLLVLLITPAGVYRFPTCQGTGLPCDEQGRVMVLK